MANVPIYNLTDTWNAGGTTFDAIKMAVTDTASASGSRLLELLVDSGGGASSKFRVDKAGNVTAAGTLNVTGAATLAAVGATNITASGTLGVTGASTLAAVGATNITASGTLGVTGATTLAGLSATNITASGTLGVTGATTLAGLSATNGTFSGTLGVTGAATLSSTLAVTGNTTLSGTLGIGGSDCILLREAANVLAMRNGTNAQTLRLYNTYSVVEGVTSYERGILAWGSNVLKLGTAKAGSGVARALELQTDGTTRVAIAAGGSVSLGGYFPSSHSDATNYKVLWLDTSNSGIFGESLAGARGITLASNMVRLANNQWGQQDATRNSFNLALGYESNNNGLSVYRAPAGAGGSFAKLFGVNENAGYFSPSVGIGTTSPGRKLDVNDASGNCLRLTYNDANGSAANYADFLVSSSGDLTITPSGGDVAITGAVETAAPTGGTAAKWKLGTVASVTPTSPDRTIEVEIGGTTYYLAAKTTND